MYLSEFPGPNFGCREAAINGHKEIDRRCRELGVDTIVVFDVHWQVNSEYHINCGPKFEGTYTSNELPHFIKNMPYAYPGNPALGHLIADVANEMGVKSRAHSDTTLELEYGTLVPMRYMNTDQHYKVISISGWCDWHDLTESAASAWRCGARSKSATTALWPCSPADRCRTTSPTTAARRSSCTRSTTPSWSRSTGAWSSCGRPANGRPSSACCRMYAEKCWGEGDMHDTAMLLGLLGWDRYAAPVEIVTPYFGSSGTGQINAIFPVTPLEANG
jgi:3,4-dihydroxyphenylacetate 2,3-dioxygenase